MQFSVFCGVSVDGYLARLNHTFDFLDTPGQGPHGFDEFYSSVDAVLIGRRTFDVVLRFPQWAYGRKPVFVLTHRPADFSTLPDAVVEAIAGPPGAVAARLAARGFRNVYVDGGLTIQQFLAAGLVDRLIVTRVPVLIGEGIPLFGPVPNDIPLRHVETRSYAGGLVQSEYAFDRQPPAKKGPPAKKTAAQPAKPGKARPKNSKSGKGKAGKATPRKARPGKARPGKTRPAKTTPGQSR